MKRKMMVLWLLLLALLIPAMTVEADAAKLASGSCGDNLTWELDDSGVLVISGTGAMYNYDWDGGPWYDEVREVIISEGVTSVGNNAFSKENFDTGTVKVELVSVDLPESIVRIGESAFVGNVELTSIIIPKGVKEIGSAAFFSTGLTEIVLPEGVTAISSELFRNCKNLTEVSIPESVTCIKGRAFEESALTSITIPKNVVSIAERAFFNWNALERITFEGKAPFFEGSSVFSGTTATAYYPADDPTWTEEICQNYGGTINWVAVNCPDAEKNYIERMELEKDSISAWPGTIISVNVVCTPGDASKDLVCSVSDSSILAYNESMGDHTTGFYFNCLKGGTATVTITDAFTGKSVNQVIHVFTQPTIESLPYNDTVNGECRYSFTPEETGVYTLTKDSCIMLAVIGGTLPNKSILLPKENILLCGNTVYELYTYHRSDFCTEDQACSFGIDICKDTEGQILMLLEETVEVTLRTTTEPTVWRTQVYYTGTEPLTVTSSNTDVVEFDYEQDGNVWIKAKAAGTSILTVSDGFHSDSLTVIVKPAPYCPPDGHQYGKPVFSWQEYTSCTADFICTICGDIQNVLCTVTSVTVPATEDQEGKTTYTATASFNGETYSDTTVESLPKLEHIHSFAESWLSDKTNHWKQCSACGEKKDISVHIPGDKATENKSQKCTICGHVLRTPLGLDWFFEKMENSSFLPSGFYAEIMEQYTDFGR